MARYVEIQFPAFEGTMNKDYATKAQQAMDALKQRGQWRDDYDERGLPAIFLEAAKSSATVRFGECGNKPMLQAISDVVARITPKMVNGMIVDPDSAEFADEVRELVKRKNISYGNAGKAARAKRELRAACVEFVDNNAPLMQGMYDKASQLSTDQNIPYARALINVLDDAGYPWRKVFSALVQLNLAYTQDDDPAQLQAEAQKRANDEGISLEKATQQVDLEHKIEKSHRSMFGPHNA